MDDDRGFISRLWTHFRRDGQVWIVVAAIVFLVIVNLRYTGLLP